jgi:hypothetical protein
MKHLGAAFERKTGGELRKERVMRFKMGARKGGRAMWRTAFAGLSQRKGGVFTEDGREVNIRNKALWAIPCGLPQKMGARK